VQFRREAEKLRLYQAGLKTIELKGIDPMDQRTRPQARLAPLPSTHTPELAEQFEAARKRMGFIPNSQLIMQRRPKVLTAFAALGAAIWDPSGTVEIGLKRLIAHVASRAAGCQYCMAHTAEGAMKVGIDAQKLDAVWEYQASPLFSAAEKAALDVAVAAGCVPNAVTDELFAELHKHWTEEQIVEIVAVISYFGFLNRWNDTLATPLEEEPLHFGEEYLASHGWSAGKHRA
jgi:uncharacterized peroxidase-related enzyme